MPSVIGNIELYTGPHTLGAPDDLGKTIIDFIDGARKKLYVAVQELDSMELAQAIIRAKQRKVTVKVVLEGDYLTVKKAVPNPFDLKGQNEHNREIYAALLRAKVDVKSDFNPKIFHQKFMVRDGKSLLTGSTNFTTTGITKNLNHIVIIHDKEIAKIYNKEFSEIQRGKFGRQSDLHGKAPKTVNISGIPVKVLFAPDHSPEMEIMKQMLKASRKIDFAIFTFAQSSGIDDTMIKLSKLGLDIRGLLDGKAANQTWAATRPVKNAGADLHIVPKKGKLGKLHHKLMVLDDQVLIVGSFNYTGPANNLNDENIMVIGDLDSTGEAAAKQKALAGYALTEINRIQNTHSKKLI